MRHIRILFPGGNSIVDTIIASYNMFKMANAYHQKLNGKPEPLFTIDLVSANGEPVTYQKLFTSGICHLQTFAGHIEEH